MAWAAVGSVSTRTTASAIAAGARGGTSSPVSPSITSSGIPSTAVAITGLSQASASRMEPVMPSPA